MKHTRHQNKELSTEGQVRERKKRRVRVSNMRVSGLESCRRPVTSDDESCGSNANSFGTSGSKFQGTAVCGAIYVIPVYSADSISSIDIKQRQRNFDIRRDIKRYIFNEDIQVL